MPALGPAARRHPWWLILALGAAALAWVFYTYAICTPHAYARCTACLAERPSFCETAEDEQSPGGEQDAEINARQRAVDAVIFKACFDDWQKGRFRECEARTSAAVRECTAGTRRSLGPFMRLD